MHLLPPYYDLQHVDLVAGRTPKPRPRPPRRPVRVVFRGER
jgi:hypothetical protein